MKKRFKGVTVTTTEGRDVYHGPDAMAVFNAIHDANMNGMDMTLPITLDDTQEGVFYGLARIVKVTKTYYLEDDE